MKLPIWLRVTLAVYKDLKDPKIDLITNPIQSNMKKVKLIPSQYALALSEPDKTYLSSVFPNYVFKESPSKVNVVEIRTDKIVSRKIPIDPFEFEPSRDLLEKFVFDLINNLIVPGVSGEHCSWENLWFLDRFVFVNIPDVEEILSIEKLKQNLHPIALEIMVTQLFLIDSALFYNVVPKPKSLSELKKYLDLLNDKTLFEVILRYPHGFIGRGTELEKDDLETAKKIANAINHAYFALSLMDPYSRKEKEEGLIQIVLNTIPTEELDNLINKRLMKKVRKVLINHI